MGDRPGRVPPGRCRRGPQTQPDGCGRPGRAARERRACAPHEPGDCGVNAIGLIKQREESADAISAIRVNALFPHELASRCRACGARLIQISTDCVFSGTRGMYSEDDPPDPCDLYGRSKLLGEVYDTDTLTLRTSIVGRELQRAHGLFEWFLGQRGGRVRGYPRAVFSGLTTAALADLIGGIVERHQGSRGCGTSARIRSTSSACC